MRPLVQAPLSCHDAPNKKKKHSQHPHPISIETTGIATYRAGWAVFRTSTLNKTVQRVRATKTIALSHYSITKDSM